MSTQISAPRRLGGLIALLIVLACGTPAQRTGAPIPASPGGAGTPDQAAGAPAPAAPSPPAKLLVGRAGSGTAPQFWPGYVAIKLGYFTQEGLDFETLAIPSAYTLTQSLIAGDMQVINYTVLSMAAAVVAGAPLKMVASAQDLPNLQVIAAPEIRSWADFRGKTLGSGNSAGDYFDVALRLMLAANGLHESDVTIRTMSSTTRLPSLLAGQIAGAIMSENDAAHALEVGNKSLGFVGEYVKDLQYSGYLVSDHWARANEGTLLRFLRGMLRGAAWVFDPANKDEALRIYAEVSDLDLDQVEEIYHNMITRQMLSRDLRPNMKGIENVVTVAYQQGALTEIPPLERWVDLSYLDKASR
ncbi:MAG TPA: ABC transporter substrate-binding protein [Chloroflexota bacterium]|nr:ABC transporter substrate-binding protein [Chloroflexota bacterium]